MTENSLNFSGLNFKTVHNLTESIKNVVNLGLVHHVNVVERTELVGCGTVGVIGGRFVQEPDVLDQVCRSVNAEAIHSVLQPVLEHVLQGAPW